MRPADIVILKIDVISMNRILWIEAKEPLEKYPWHIVIFGIDFTKVGYLPDRRMVRYCSVK